uniref:Poly [ADP-ribose] polymerase n=1 Tax=Lepisosteus oculatus TaxID=7918 RepID=W5LY42_LEPOC|nr:PREDICTED: poly [ADP-ribose] polymerase 14-like [Lepisosteus oculatus]
MENCQFPVFFEVSHLDEKTKEKLENYFKIRRKSGGGECGKIDHTGGNVYKICFQKREDQERVLQKKDHVVETSSGPITLLVRSPEGPPASPLKTPPASPSSANQQSSIPQSPLSAAATVHPTSYPGHPASPGKVLQLDHYLLRYLQECPQAGEDLKDLLSALSCSVRLIPEAEEAVVTLEGSAWSVQWEAQVDEVFRGIQRKYPCHYEPDLTKQQILKKHAFLTSSGVCVYSEPSQGFVVIVGQQRDVEERLKVLDGITEREKGRKGQSTKCRIPGVGYNLIRDSLERELRAEFPNLNVYKEDMSSLTLEGSHMDIQAARSKLKERLGRIQERVVTLPRPLISFLKDTGGVDEFTASFFNTLRSQVIMDVDLDLKIFSLSREALDGAEKIIRRELQVEDVVLGGELTSASRVEKLRASLDRIRMRLNQGRRRVQFQFVQGASEGTLCIQIWGFKDEVGRLGEEVKRYMTDEETTIEAVELPDSGMVDFFFDVLDLISVPHEGVELATVSSPAPAVQLKGPHHLVMALKGSLKKALDALVWEVLTINKPGAFKYFQDVGNAYLTMVGKLHHCLIRPSQPGQVTAADPAQAASQGVWCSFRLEGGLTLMVRLGDITMEKVDAIVNAANEDLDHCGGIALVISNAGGPSIQKESKEWVKRNGKLPTGKAVETSAGSLPFKMVIHAVGPMWHGRQGVDGVRRLLDGAVRESLEIAERGGCRSLAIPCLSSGIFGVPVDICAQTIVEAVRNFARMSRTLQAVTLVDTNRDTVSEFQAACGRVLGGVVGLPVTLENSGASGSEVLQTTSSPVPRNSSIQVDIMQGSIESQQTDVVVSPMRDQDLMSTRVGQCLAGKSGDQLNNKFSQAVRQRRLVPGDVLPVDGVSGLAVKHVFFIECLKWDGSHDGRAMEALRRGLRCALERCETQGLSSITFPVIGPGVALGFSHSVAAHTLLEEIGHFEQDRLTHSVSHVRIIIHPSDKVSSVAFQEAQQRVRLRGLQMALQPVQTTFYHSLSLGQDDVSVMVGGVRMQIVFGDIVKEAVDVIVNSTDFSSNSAGVSRAILSAAGATVQAELARVTSPPDGIFTTQPGNLRCKTIAHVCGKNSLEEIRKLSGKILKLCEQRAFKSVAFPAIGTGVAGMDPKAVSKSMIDGISSAVRDGSFQNLSTVRLVLLQRNVFEAFKSEAESRLGKAAPQPTFIEYGKKLIKQVKNRGEQPSKMAFKGGKSSMAFCTPEKQFPAAVFDIIGQKKEDVKKAKEQLESIFQKQFCEKEIDEEEVGRLGEEEIPHILDRAISKGVTIRRGKFGKFILQGLKDMVMDIFHVMHVASNKSLAKQLEERQQALLAQIVLWQYNMTNNWENFDKEANYLLEMGHQKKAATVDVSDKDGTPLRVDLKTKTAEKLQSSQTVQVRRRELRSDFCFPEYWDNMAEGEILKKVVLQVNSSEYQEIAHLFNKTSRQKAIHTIERVQNVHLRRAYWVKEQHLREKNSPNEVGEKMLFHGTAYNACDSIEKGGFNRSFSGQHATAFGAGVYFAVNSSYSANPTYSSPDPNGFQRMYVARVLTGRYTLGKSNMRVPPARSSADPNDRFDSVVDNPQNPSMFVTFHDDQAYPDYLITFR